MSSLLEQVNSPSDLRKLKRSQLPALAGEIRRLLISSVAETGGHLAANLGVVELTLALHYVFDTPDDKLIFDVGHQCYTHKIITGRRDRLCTLRQSGGLSGFCHHEESEYDVNTTGHSSDSISIALGLAVARDSRGGKESIVALIGDGALTGGMAFEALNHAGYVQSPLIVILNDNEMSISGNVGAISNYLSRIRINPKYDQAKRKVQGLLAHLPWLGNKLIDLISSLKRSLKSALVPGMLFEDLGFTYLGPVDGHNTDTLITLLNRAKRANKPVLLHVRTVKGKGYPLAENYPDRWHGVEPFHIESGMPKNGKQNTYTQVFSDAAVALGAAHDDVCAITAAMAEGTGLSQFRDRFPDRFFDVGIAEQHALGFAAGLAWGGKHPLVALYSTFLQRGYDQVIEDICLQQLPVILAVDRAGVVNGDGCTHQGIYDLSYLRAIPGLTLMAPADGYSLSAMLRLAYELKSPVALRYPRAAAPPTPLSPAPLALGKAAVVREGNDLAIVSLGALLEQALAAAEMLRRAGIRARVVDARFAAPIDSEALLQAATECQGRILTLEENVEPGGFGEACRSLLADSRADIINAALPLAFLAHGCRETHLSAAGLDAESLATRIRERWFA